MKVKLGKYLKFYGPYQIAQLLLFWKKPDNVFDNWHPTVGKLGKFLATKKNGQDSWFYNLCNWIHEKRKRKICVRIDPWDSWNVDDTLCYIIHPLMKQLKATKHGHGRIDKTDVPEYLHSTYKDGFSEEAYEWVLGEIIWAFDPEWDEKYQWADCVTTDDYLTNYERKRNAQRLFGKYYGTFWD